MLSSNKSIKNAISITTSLVLSFALNAKSYNWSNISQAQYIDNLVSCETQLQQYKWSKNAWPKANKKPKPDFSTIKDTDKIRQQVMKNLRIQSILDATFHITINDKMLQHDINRMAANSKDVKGLKQMFALFDNDPQTIAQCISRPYLVKNKIHNSFNWHNKIHSVIKKQAQNDLKKYLKEKTSDNLTAMITTVVYKLSQEHAKKEQIEDKNKEIVINLNAEEFKKKRQQLKNNTLQEYRYAYGYSEIIYQDKNEIKVKNLSWAKQALSQWLSKQKNNMPTLTSIQAQLKLPEINTNISSFNDKSIISDAWLDDFSLSGRTNHTAIWTGTEMIIWGGYSNTNEYLNSGFRYNPSSDSWSVISTNAAPSNRSGHTAIWTGTEMIIWGGIKSIFFNDGRKYNPIEGSWSFVSNINAPEARYSHTAIWTGNEMIIWGGTGSGSKNTGGRYNPSTNSWTTITLDDAPVARYYHTAIWTSSKMIIWGGIGDGGISLSTGSSYDPMTDSWAAISTNGAPSKRFSHTAIWIGTEMIIWGGKDDSSPLNGGGRYKPQDNSWSPMSLTNTPSSRYVHTAVWTGAEMIVWGGFGSGGSLDTGASYDPQNDIWIGATTTTDSPTARGSHTAIWTGTEMIIWGGGNSSFTNTGARYNPQSNQWIATSTDGKPNTLIGKTTIWTGTEMIVWGGASTFQNTGSRYSPSTDTWIATDSSSAPVARYFHSAIWTGTEMIVWGGNSDTGITNTGGRYSPTGDSWIDTDTLSAPDARLFHTAIWTGTEMIIWGGGTSFSGGNINTGSRYNLSGNSWIATDTTTAPTARSYHTAVWTGTEMIVWGGSTNSGNSNTGARYTPGGVWVATDTTFAPDARNIHSAVWTDTEMIVWGGYTNSGLTNSGGRYKPSDDSWTVMDLITAPLARSNHSTVWTGTEMIIWSGDNYSNTGGRYDPMNDNWIATTTVNAPKSAVSAVWTGTTMLTWGIEFGIYTTQFNYYSLGGTLTGLSGNKVVLQNYFGSDTTLLTNGSFSFGTIVPQGESYDVSILKQPINPNQTCTLSNPAGSNVSIDILSIEVSCITNKYTINVTVTGLDNNNDIQLSSNSQTLNFMGSGNTSLTPLDDGTAYNFTLANQPTTPNQTCVISGGNSGNDDGSGVLAGNDIEINVICTTIKYDVQIAVTGLDTGNSVSFVNGTDSLILNINGTSTISSLNDGSGYNISIITQPTEQTCEFTTAKSGIIAGSDITISALCEASLYNLNLNVSGLAFGNSISFSNGLDNLVIQSDGTEILSSLANGSTYNILITAPPDTPSQLCTFSNANSGIINQADTMVNVICTIEQFAIGGSVSGLASGNSLTITNNGVDNLVVNSNGGFSFNNAIDDASIYFVSVFSQPLSPKQTCSISNHFGVINSLDISNVIINCETNTYFVSGYVSGLHNGNYIWLQQNGADSLLITSNGAYVFNTAVADLQSYLVSIFLQPSTPIQTCSVANASATINGDDVIDVDINCPSGNDLIFSDGFEN